MRDQRGVNEPGPDAGISRSGELEQSPAPRWTIEEPCISTRAGQPRIKRRGVSYCGADDCAGPGKCRACHAAYMRSWRRARNGGGHG